MTLEYSPFQLQRARSLEVFHLRIVSIVRPEGHQAEFHLTINGHGHEPDDLPGCFQVLSRVRACKSSLS